MQIPNFFFNVEHSQYTWNYYTEKSQRAFKSYADGNYWPAGRVLGGTSQIDGMTYQRGNKRDYDNWEKLGNPGWGHESVLPFFKKSENNKKFRDRYHSQEGPMSVEHFKNVDFYKQIILEAASQQGYRRVNDFNTESNMGFGLAQGSLLDGERHSTAKAFLSSIKTRPNLQIIKNANVTTLMINNKKQVNGVNFILNGTQMQALASKEVIISAGVIGSPRILLNSGIGPSQDLAALNIPVVKNLAVGKNLQDHVVTQLAVKLDKSTAVADNLENYASALQQYYENRSGPFSGIGVTDVEGFLNTNKSSAKYPDIQVIFLGLPKQMIGFKEFVGIFGYQPQYAEQLIQANNEAYLLMMYSVLLNPKSRGYVKLNSKDPLDPPKIVSNYLEEQEDRDVLFRGLKKLREFLSTSVFKKHEAEEVRMKVDECDKFEYNTNSYWDCYISYFSSTVFRYVGTVKMGPSSDPDAVVNAQLKIKRFEKLRVIDASIMPTIPSADVRAAVMMIAEKGADMIKKDWL